LNRVVVDASLALAWCFPDEASDYADMVLVSLEGNALLVPAVWGLEIANAILVGERAKRLSGPDIRQFTNLLQNLAIEQDVQPFGNHLNDVLEVAREAGLTAYDASYLELAIRKSAALATLDGRLSKAAKRSGIKIFGERAGR